MVQDLRIFQDDNNITKQNNEFTSLDNIILMITRITDLLNTYSDDLLLTCTNQIKKTAHNHNVYYALMRPCNHGSKMKAWRHIRRSN